MLADEDVIPIPKLDGGDSFTIHVGPIGALKIGQDVVGARLVDSRMEGRHGKVVNDDSIILMAADSHAPH
jgi:hypothetical protein